MTSVAINITPSLDIIFRCERCDTPIINNSREHDECWCNNDDEWFCGDCKHDAMEEEEEEEEELCCRDCGGEVGECCCDYGNPELARLRDGDSEEEADKGFSWENMDFGTAENPTCGICGKREDNPYAFDEDGNLVEDVICAKCDSIYVYDEELDSYIQKT